MGRWFKARKTRLVIAWLMFWGSLIGWPLSIWLSDEPIFILSLSWFAITATAYDVICTTELKPHEQPETKTRSGPE